MNRCKSIWIYMLLVALCLSVLPIPAAYAEQGGLSARDRAAIEDIISSNLDRSKAPGVAVVIVQGGDVVYSSSFGYANKETGEKLTAESLFELGSVSKAYTAMAVLKLRDQGLIHLDDPITAYIPWLSFTYKGKEATITVRQLLHHTSGIPSSALGKIPEASGTNAIEAAVRTLIGQKLVEKPGEEFVYSTINYDVLGHMIERVTGMPFADYMTTEIFKPLGLNQTYIGKENAPSGQLTAGYKWSFTRPKAYEAPYYGGNAPAAYVITNALDMAQWLKVQLGTAEADEQLLRLAAETQQANRTVAPFTDGSSYAMGWNVLQRGGGQLFHDGNNPNFFNSMILRPKEQLGIAVLSNLETYNPQIIARQIANYLVGNDEVVPYYDNYARLDKVGSFLIIISGLFALLVLYSLCMLGYQIARKQRKAARIRLKGVVGVVAVLPLLALGYVCLDYVPRLLFQNDWKTLYVYAPGTFYIGVVSVGIVGLAYFVYFLLQLLFPKQGKFDYLTLGVLSMLSGFGNALIIYSINSVVSRRAEVGWNETDQSANILLLYFGMGILLYVAGQRVLRPILIRLSNDIIYRKRTELLSKILRISYQDLEKIKRENIQSTLNNDTETISSIVNLVVSGVTSMITLVFCFVYLGLINIVGLLISFGVLLCAAAMYYFVGKRANVLWEQTRDIQNVFFKFINDLAQGFKELALNGKKRKDFQQDFDESCEEYRVKRTEGDINFAMVFIIGELLFVIILGVIGFLFPLVFDNAFTFVRDYVFVFIYMIGPINVILSSIPQLTRIRVSWKRIDELNQTLDGVMTTEERLQPVAADARIELAADRIEFEYQNTNGDLFHVGPISTVFRSGEVVFITGGNGSGKSTFAKMLTGLYRPSKGALLLNGKQVGHNELNEHFTAIFSDFYVFNRLYGIDFASKKNEIHEYLELLHLSEKIRIENGFISTIELSTGQKKRLALLVSYLDDKPIYLFDEWAADQDPEYRKFFYHHLLPELKRRGKCVIAITHDDMYFHLADKFIKLDYGRIVEERALLETAAASE